jgi:acyl-CoA thioesterase
MTALPAVLQVQDLGDGHYAAPHPENDPEQRGVVFSGQILAQMIMVSDLAVEHAKEAKSIHTIFARAGTYSAGPLDYVRDPMHSGRAWGSDTITVTQGDRLLSRGLVLMNTVEPDLMRHAPAIPDVPGPDGFDPAPFSMFDTVESRAVVGFDATDAGGTPTDYTWIRSSESYDSVAANQAVVAWMQPGTIIGLAMRPHTEIDIRQAHREISTGVISHTCHFHEHFDVGDWLLLAQHATYAGRGRVYGVGEVFTRDGALVASFAQDSMARRVEAPLEGRNAM